MGVAFRVGGSGFMDYEFAWGIGIREKGRYRYRVWGSSSVIHNAARVIPAEVAQIGFDVESHHSLTSPEFTHPLLPRY